MTESNERERFETLIANYCYAVRAHVLDQHDKYLAAEVEESHDALLAALEAARAAAPQAQPSDWMAATPSDTVAAEYGAQAQPAPADPLNWPIPCDLQAGSCTLKKGAPLRTVLARMESLCRTVDTLARSPEPAPISDALAVLRELVACKDLKDEESRLRQRRECSIMRQPNRLVEVNAMRDDYNRRKPIAWERARALLAEKGPQ